MGLCGKDGFGFGECVRVCEVRMCMPIFSLGGIKILHTILLTPRLKPKGRRERFAWLTLAMSSLFLVVLFRPTA